jgi:hypothetical protein
MAEPERYYARRPFRYTAEITLDQGQVALLVGVRGDEPLVRLGYFGKLTDEDAKGLVQCGVCGAEFVQARFRELHGDRRHRPRPDEQALHGAGYGFADASGDAEERRLEREAPLYLDQTEASRR